VFSSPRRLNRIHLLHNTPYEKDDLSPVAAVAERAGYEVRFSDTRPDDEPVEISIYSGHARDPDLPRTVPTASVLSIVMLHDLGQGTWPSNQTATDSLWHHEPWDAFDIGILPGHTWSEAWRRSSGSRGARPRIGVFELGYPKADRVFDDRAAFEDDVGRLRERLKLTGRPTILLAPSWESEEHDRCAGFIRALGDLDMDLLVKYQDGDGAIARRNAERYREGHGNVTFLDVEIGIMTCLALADVVVSDESDCLAEALLFDIPGVSVIDWDVPPVPSWGVPGRPVDPPEFARKVSSDRLRATILDTLAELPRHRERARAVRDETFTNLGSSAAAIVELIETVQRLPAFPVTPRHACQPDEAEADR
jgi:hypothetical protein